MSENTRYLLLSLALSQKKRRKKQTTNDIMNYLCKDDFVKEIIIDKKIYKKDRLDDIGIA